MESDHDKPSVSRPFFKVVLWLILFACWGSGIVYANHQVDEIEAELSEAVGAAVESRVSETLPQEDQAYANFLIAVYKHSSAAREKAQEAFGRLNTPDSPAFLGSLEMVKARDFSGGFFQLLKRKKMAQRGIAELDRAAEAHPDDIKVRIVRAIGFLGLPSLFGKFEEGLADMERVIQWLEEGKIEVPEEEPFFRDRTSLYYYAGRYYLKKNDKKKAKEMFSKASGSTFHSPFAVASRRRLAALS